MRQKKKIENCFMVTSILTSCHLSINLDDLGGAKIIRLPLFFIFSRLR